MHAIFYQAKGFPELLLCLVFSLLNILILIVCDWWLVRYVQPESSWILKFYLIVRSMIKPLYVGILSSVDYFLFLKEFLFHSIFIQVVNKSIAVMMLFAEVWAWDVTFTCEHVSWRFVMENQQTAAGKTGVWSFTVKECAKRWVM